MPSILKIRRDWSLLHFEIRKHSSPHKISKNSERLEPSIRRDWSTPSHMRTFAFAIVFVILDH